MQTKDPRFNNETFASKTVTEYLHQYSEKLFTVLKRVDEKELQKAFDLLQGCFQNQNTVYVAGNGGSAAIADHLCCDWMKGTQSNTEGSLRVNSLVSNVSLLTATANDFGYVHVFEKQLQWLGKNGDLCVLISSSGNSENIIRAAETALNKNMSLITMSGFSGGKLKSLGHANLYISENNYGIVEDSHQVLMHVLAQYFAQLRDQKKQ